MAIVPYERQIIDINACKQSRLQLFAILVISGVAYAEKYRINKTVSIGDTAYLTCDLPIIDHTPINWFRCDHGGRPTRVTINGIVVERYRDRFILGDNGSLLTILTVLLADAGCYECDNDNGAGVWQGFWLYVQASPFAPVTEHDNSSDQIASPADLSITHEGRLTERGQFVIGGTLIVVFLCATFATILCVLVRRGEKLCQPASHIDVEERRALQSDIVVRQISISKVNSAAYLIGRIYVTIEDSDTIEVFDVKSIFRRRFESIQIKDSSLREIVACREDSTLYVNDWLPSTAGFIWRKLHGKDVEKWIPKNNSCEIYPTSLSVSSLRRLLVVSEFKDLLLYEPSGDKITSVSLSGCEVVHARETPRESFVVCCWKPTHRVIEINHRGDILHSYDGSDQGGLHFPHCCEQYVDNKVLVVDKQNNRILVLSADLKFQEILINETIASELISPQHLCYARDIEQFLVSCTGRVLVISRRRVTNRIALTAL